ncbi:MAG: NAD(P)H-dependent oxidoreductase [Thomasclavelia sp.]|nr:NAD(P)H-dependent oxidoreductase [Thomasclavelia sp.]
MKTLFINGSPNKDGNTSRIVNEVLRNKDFQTLNIIDYQINVYGQNKKGDQFQEVLDEISKNDLIIIGSPLYWHNICGSIRTLLDRFYGPVSSGEFSGKKLLFVFQGAAPEKWMLEAGEYTMKRFASLYGFEYLGMVTSLNEAKEINI